MDWVLSILNCLVGEGAAGVLVVGAGDRNLEGVAGFAVGRKDGGWFFEF